jgi:acetolactate synthase-1/2/3 large subunit
MTRTSSHALLRVFAANGLDRVFLVPGESYLGLLDALHDFPAIDVMTCRHEAGAGFMAVADARLTRRPAMTIVSRGPGASNAAIAVHTAREDAVPFVLVVGQVPSRDLRREAFQEIDYQKMYGALAKWVVEPTEPTQLAEIAFKAVRIATSGTPGPVVIAVPEDIQQQNVAAAEWAQGSTGLALPAKETLRDLCTRLEQARRPLIIAGGQFDRPGGREALHELAEAWSIPVAVSFRRHDLFSNRHPLYVGDLGLVNPQQQIDAFRRSDLLLALGTRLGDITSQGYTFPDLPVPRQTLVHCYPDPHAVGLHFAPHLGLVCDAVALAHNLVAGATTTAARAAWASELRGIYESLSSWPQPLSPEDGVDFTQVAGSLYRQAPRDAILCLDAGTFGAPFYRHFQFQPPQRLLAPISGAMGYGVPSAIASQLRFPERKTICVVGDGGFMMTGNEMIAAVERNLPILFVVSNNCSYASIRIQQEREHPDRPIGTSLFNPEFVALARAYGMRARRLDRPEEIDDVIREGLSSSEPYFIEVRTSLSAVLPMHYLERTGPSRRTA